MGYERKLLRSGKRNSDRRQIQFWASETESGGRALRSRCPEVSWKYECRFHHKRLSL